jgi:hypothetical protein
MSGAAGTIQLAAGWAVWGKRPGSGDDYRVLESSSEPVDAQDFARILAHFEPGTPPTEAGRPDSLPWVTVSWMSLSEQPYVGMALQEATEDVDRVGRPITRTSYFCFPYASLAHGPVSYLGLYRALAGVRLPRPHGAEILVTVPVLDPARLAEDVTDLGEAAVSSAAALLLRGAVTVTGADRSTLEQRLRFLDAVAALLPYGYRAGNTAATWSDSGARHRIKLAFAARAKEGASGVAWRGVQPPPEGIADPAARYYRQLRVLRERRANVAELTGLIEYLARDTIARGFDVPGPAIDGLREFDLPFAILDEVRRQAADPAQVRRVFTTSRVTELPADGRHDLLAALIESGDPADVDVARAWWDQAAAGDPSRLVTALATPVRDLLWRVSPARPAADGYLRLAAEHELTDGLLAKVVPPPADDPGLAAGRDAVARVIADLVFGGASTAAFPRTRQALAFSPLVSCSLIARLAGPGPGAAAVLDWLRPAADGLLAPFTAALGLAPAAVEPGQVGALVRHDDECARLLLAAASAAGRLDHALPGFAGWAVAAVARPGSGTPVRPQYWRDVLTALPAGSASVRAWIDLALLALGADPRFLLSGEAGVPDYSQAFADGWNRLTAGQQGQVIDGMLTAALTGCLRGRHWARDQAQVSTVADIVDRLTAGGRRRRLEAQVAAAVATSGARAWLSVKGWVDRLLQAHPDAVQEGTLILLHEPPAHATAAELAELCVQAFTSNLTAGQAATALAQSGALRTGAGAMGLLAELRHLLPESGPATEWMAEFIQVTANGTIGWPIAAEFRELAVSQSLDEIDYRLHLLFTGAGGGSPATSAPALPDEAVKRLEQAGKTIEQILKVTRPKASRPRQRKDDGRPGEAAVARDDGAGT